MIVGGDACVKTPKTCDLSKGIVVNGNTVTFHLTKGDPEFLDKLGVPFAFILPASTPAKNVDIPPPGTGPYKWAEYAPTKQIKLVRNPYFKVWSSDAQPAGNPDVILQKFGLTPDNEVTQVEQGQADWVFDQIPAGRLNEISTKYPDQVHINQLTQVEYFAFNTRIPPFNNLKARQAVNFATDRSALVKIFGGPQLAVPTCQVLPPSFPGYEPYCPYTINPGSGKWTGPDMNKAKQLMAQSGTKGAVVKVNTVNVDPPKSYGLYFVGLAEQARVQGIAPGALGEHPVPLHPELEEQGPVRVFGLVPGLPGGFRLPRHPPRLWLVPPEQQLEPEHRRVLQPGHPVEDGPGGPDRPH